jgi:hypothetical protein
MMGAVFFAGLGTMICFCDCLAMNITVVTGGITCEYALRDYMKSFRKFFGEAVMKPGQPVGMGMFFPCKSGNWRGVLQQWLVIHLYQWTLMSLALVINCLTRYGFLGLSKGSGLELFDLLCYIYFFVLCVFLTWHFWFALTQRKPRECILIRISIPAFGLVGPSFLFLLFTFLELAESRAMDGDPDAMIIFSIMTLLATTELCLGICLVMASMKTGESPFEAQVQVSSNSGQILPEEHNVGKRGDSKQSVSTETTDAENPTAAGNHDGKHDTA